MTMAEQHGDDGDEPNYIEACLAALAAHDKTRTVGRPPTWKPRAVRKLLDALERGHFQGPACRLAGIKFRTFRDWMDEGSKEGAEDTPQGILASAVEHAEAIGEDKNVSLVNDAAKSDYKAASFLLSRRHRERWAERKPDDHRNGGVTVIVAVPGHTDNPRPVITVGHSLTPAAFREARETALLND